MSEPPARRPGTKIEDVASIRLDRALIRAPRLRDPGGAARLNTELVMLYWSIGREILEQEQTGWGA